MANTSGSKIEATNHDFNILFNAVFNFLHDDQRVATTSTDSKITSYTFKGNNSYPHNMNASQQETTNDIIDNNYATSLNIIYDIIYHNYMKTNGLSSTKINEYKTTSSIIPALDQHIAIVNYWNNNGSSACNGACVGYCVGNCADNESKGAGCSGSNCTGNNTVRVGSTYCASCDTICSSVCAACDEACLTVCEDSCAELCKRLCSDLCDTGCYESCKVACADCAHGCRTDCKSDCDSVCIDQCGSNCRKTCDSYCINGCPSGCKSRCNATCNATSEGGNQAI